MKICGLMNPKDVGLCIHAGVHMFGFVVEYPVTVPWNLTKVEAGELIQQAPPFVSTCVVTGGSIEKILDIVTETCPNVVQLHYKETLQEVREIACQLKLRGIKTIKALRLDGEGKCDFEITNPVMAARELAKTGVSAILVDSYTPSRPGGTGVTPDLATFRIIQQESILPVILAGGLNQANILPLVQQTHPYAVDVLSGVEEIPGHKDPEKVIGFMRNVQSLAIKDIDK
ncbi:phosphoribosylanthranilate isomerase [Phosphitispora sp. TUW77]|uniref:phosphoribosylanthranilate isomerase n=1 Tax=Phosphitispora sp. TUW77 TaxID=3152361 RepID=UPI003AB7CB23